MATANYYLKNPVAESETPINLYFQYNGRTLKYGTGIQLHPKFWDKDKQRARKPFTGSPELNTRLSDIEKAVGKIYSNQYNANGIVPTPEYLRDKLNEELNRQPKQNISFTSLFEQFIEQSRTTKQINTIKKYKTCLNLLKDFSKKKHTSLSFENFNSDFYEKFVKFLFEDKDTKHTNNTAGKYIQTLKTFLHYATEKGYNQKFDFKKFKVFKEDTEIIYLTEDELNTLANFDLSDNTRLERVRDLFLFGCYTGLRFSDIEKLKPENIKKDYIILQAQKTKTNNTLPLSPLAKGILKKYDNTLPNVITNQKTNEYLKELCKLAEIDEPTQTTKHRGAMRITETLPKYDLIGTHTARRTFVTLSLEKGMRAETVMEITGHKTYQSFKRYVSVTDKVKQNEMNRIWSVPVKLRAVSNSK